MALEMTVDSLEAISDEALRAAYSEKDGKFHLDPDKYADYKATGLKKKNSQILEEKKQAQASLKRFEALSELDDDEIAEMLKSRGNGSSKGKADEEIAKLSKAHEKKTQLLDKQIADLIAENRNFKLTVPVRQAAANAGIISTDIDDVVLLTQSRFRLNDDGKVEVLDKDGDPLGITVQKFFETVYKEEKPKFYQASGAGGSGSPATSKGGGAGKSTITRAQYNAMSMAERSEIDFKTTTVVD